MNFSERLKLVLQEYDADGFNELLANASPDQLQEIEASLYAAIAHNSEAQGFLEFLLSGIEDLPSAPVEEDERGIGIVAESDEVWLLDADDDLQASSTQITQHIHQPEENSFFSTKKISLASKKVIHSPKKYMDMKASDDFSGSFLGEELEDHFYRGKKQVRLAPKAIDSNNSANSTDQDVYNNRLEENVLDALLDNTPSIVILNENEDLEIVGDNRDINEDNTSVAGGEGA